MNKKELVDFILQIPSETRAIEFKRLGSRNEVIDKILQTIVAMANTDGGTIILGVDDLEKTTKMGLDRIYGIEENLELFDELGHSVKKIIPPISNIWPPQLVQIDGKEIRIGLLYIPKVIDNFRSFENHVYIRQEKGNKMLNPQEIVHFSYIKGFERADRELVDVEFYLLKSNYYESWRKKRGIEQDDIEIILEKTGLARKNNDGKILPTRAATMLFSEFPSDLLDTKCAIRVFQYNGNLETISETLNLIGNPKTIGGPMIKQISDTHEYVLNLLRTGIRVPSGFVTQFRVPERAIKEAITNAVIHRDYHTKRDIEIKIFEDRIEIENPGLLPFNITPSNIGIERSLGYRNDLLVKALREFPDPPNLDQNEGVHAMRQLMHEGNLYPPIFLTYPILQDATRVVLFNEKAPREWDKISTYLGKNKYIANKEARKILLIQDTAKVSRLLNLWTKKRLLTKIVPQNGSKRNVRYRLPSQDEKILFASGQNK